MREGLDWLMPLLLGALPWLLLLVYGAYNEVWRIGARDSKIRQLTAAVEDLRRARRSAGIARLRSDMPPPVKSPAFLCQGAHDVQQPLLQ
mmetsp:Transcript_32575/g.92363  ORF Transcript_32575/g.92363 Transcript_32575/m.92363 type:complete len:90 (+) Transcript_32575:372-641(+)